MANMKKLDELIEQINTFEKAGTYALSSYKPDRKRLYRLDEIDEDDDKHLRVVSKFMTFHEMDTFLEGFLEGIDSCS